MENDIVVTKEHLLEEVKKFAEKDARFVIATCVDLGEKLEIIYHFDTLGEKPNLVNLRMQFSQDEEIPSIASIYPCAALIEGEIVDMFEARIKGIPSGLLLAPDSPKAPLRKKKGEKKKEVK
ncbi:MAG: NADH-quinone oxidoreductase subunit C [Thermoplasmata archaeon]|nr:NADH-quinone oxidoreductase subunit C [Thermoplasmata archaeon]